MIRQRFALVLACIAISSLARADTFEDAHSCICRVGDCDGDGVPDLLVASRNEPREPHYFLNAGHVWLISGKTGRLLWTARGAAKGDAFGCSLAAAGDVDGDGIPDVIVGALVMTDRTAPGIDPRTADLSYARVLSGKDGHVLREFRSSSSSQILGYSVAGGVDFDGDGTPDVLLGAPSIRERAYCSVFSGKTGKELLRVECKTVPADDFAKSVASLGDLDGDGRSEIAIGAGTASHGTVLVCSGKDGSIERTLSCERLADFFGWSLATWNDPLDKKHGVLAVAAPGYLVRTYSLDTWSVLGTANRGEHGGDMRKLGFGTSLDLDVVNVEMEPRLLVGTQDVDIIEGHSGQAAVMRVDGTYEFPVCSSDNQGIDACFAGDIDGDGVVDTAVVLLKDRILRIWSGKYDKMLVEVKLRGLDKKTEAK